MIWTSISPISRCPPPLGTHLPVGGYDDNIMPILCSTGSLQARPIIVDVPVHNIIWIGHPKQGTTHSSKPQQPPQDAWTNITTCGVSSFTMPNTAWYRWMSKTIKTNINSVEWYVRRQEFTHTRMHETIAPLNPCTNCEAAKCMEHATYLVSGATVGPGDGRRSSLRRRPPYSPCRP